MADSGDNFFKGFILGGIIGATLGVLLAPKSGRETREELSKESEKFMGKAKVDIESARKAAMKTFEESKGRIIEKLAQKEQEENIAEGEDKLKNAKSSKDNTKKATKKSSGSKS